MSTDPFCPTRYGTGRIFTAVRFWPLRHIVSVRVRSADLSITHIFRWLSLKENAARVGGMD